MSIKPDFFIVGAAKAGTTALQQMLGMHPDIYMSPIKEPNFFYNDIPTSELRKPLQEKLKKENAEQWIKDGMHGELWNAFLTDEHLYQHLFSKALPNQMCGEASVSYLYSNNAAKNIFNYNPKAKIIIMLRNPAERAWSHFQMEMRMGLTNGNFKESFDKYNDKLNAAWGKDPIFLTGGFYYHQVKRYLDIFPKEQVLICLYDDYKRNAETTLKNILSFIGASTTKELSEISVKRANEARSSVVDKILPSGGFKSRLRKIVQLIGVHKYLKKWLSSESNNKISDENRKLLINYYLDDIEKLESHLGVELKNWKTL